MQNGIYTSMAELEKKKEPESPFVAWVGVISLFVSVILSTISFILIASVKSATIRQSDVIVMLAEEIDLLKNPPKTVKVKKK